jgi:hypothetical protein
MTWNYQRFASAEQITRWRAFSLVKGWEAGGSLELHNGEIRLFDAPIEGGFLAPSFRIRELAYVRLKPGGTADEELVRIRKGWLCATDRRFVAYNESSHEGDDIPYRRITDVEYKNGDFLLTVDRRGVITDRLQSMPVRNQYYGTSDRGYATGTLLPAYAEASYHAVSTALIKTVFPQSGLLEALTIIGAPSNAERLWYASLVQEKNQSGQDFVSAFFYFLNEIADQNRI